MFGGSKSPLLLSNVIRVHHISRLVGCCFDVPTSLATTNEGVNAYYTIHLLDATEKKTSSDGLLCFVGEVVKDSLNPSWPYIEENRLVSEIPQLSTKFRITVRHRSSSAAPLQTTGLKAADLEAEVAKDLLLFSQDIDVSKLEWIQHRKVGIVFCCFFIRPSGFVVVVVVVVLAPLRLFTPDSSCFTFLPFATQKGPLPELMPNSFLFFLGDGVYGTEEVFLHIVNQAPKNPYERKIATQVPRPKAYARYTVKTSQRRKKYPIVDAPTILKNATHICNTQVRLKTSGATHTAVSQKATACIEKASKGPAIRGENATRSRRIEVLKELIATETKLLHDGIFLYI